MEFYTYCEKMDYTINIDKVKVIFTMIYLSSLSKQNGFKNSLLFMNGLIVC